MRTCIVTQVRNGFEYIPAFLAHHFNLVDDIFLIDHLSSKDLREISSDRLKVKRINILDFKKEHYINYVLDQCNIKNEYQTIFILDIDEFLPFYHAHEFNKFLIQNKNNDVFSFNWSNGFPVNPGKLDASTQLYFCRRYTATQKLGYNTLRNRRFLPVEGNHHAKYPLLDLGPIQVRPKTASTGIGLLHIPFLNSDTLKQKMSDDNSKYFKTKIEKCATYTGQEIDGIEDKFEDDPHRYINFIANYRTNNKKDVFDVTMSDFELHQPFSGREDSIEDWRVRLEKIPTINAMVGIVEKSEALSKLRIKSVGYIRRLRATFREDADGGITVA